MSVRHGLEEQLPRLWRYAIALSRDHERACDLVQATCVRALEREAQFVRGTRLDHWLLAILTSIWRNDARANTVRLGGGHEDATETLTVDGAWQAEVNIYLSQVLSYIDRLPAGQRETVLLVCAEGCSYQEAADILAIPIGTVMSRLASARRRLAALTDRS